MKKHISLDTVTQIILLEMDWCNKHPNSVSEEYHKGFIAGLKQVGYLIKKAAENERRLDESEEK